MVKLSYSCTPIWQTSSQLTTRSSLGPTTANQNLNPVTAGISRHAHWMATAETKQSFTKQLYKPKINPRTISDCAKPNLKQDSITTTIPSIRIPKKNATELSKFIWSCKDSVINPAISWKIICHATPYQHGGKVCNLCLAEKYEILTANDDALLNKRTELINKCRHKNKYKLINGKLKLWFSFIFLFFFFFAAYNVLP